MKRRLRAALQFIVDTNFAATDRRGCLAVNTAAELAGTDAEATGQVRRMFDRTEAAFQAAIEEGQRSGEIGAGLDARAIGSLLLNTVVGMQLLAKTAAGPDRLTRVIEAVLAPL